MYINPVISIFRAQISRCYSKFNFLLLFYFTYGEGNRFLTAGASVRHQHLPGHRLGQAGPWRELCCPSLVPTPPGTGTPTSGQSFRILVKKRFQYKKDLAFLAFWVFFETKHISSIIFWVEFRMVYTDKKENTIFLIYKEIQEGAVAKSCMTNGLPICDLIFALFLIYKKALPYIWLCNRFHLNFLIYEENFVIFFISVIIFLMQEVLEFYPVDRLSRNMQVSTFLSYNCL